MNVVVEVERWLFMSRQEADGVNVPTILVEKTAEGAKSFTSMRNLFQMKKWTTHGQFIPLLSVGVSDYQSFEVFQVDAAPPFTILENGRVFMRDQQIDSVYASRLEERGLDKASDILAFAIAYLEEVSGRPWRLATASSNDGMAHVPESLYVAQDAVETGNRLFDWMATENEVTTR